MPDKPELGPGAAPVKVEHPGRFQRKTVQPTVQQESAEAPIQGPRKPTFRERVSTRYETHRQERAIAKTPEARKKRIAERKEGIELRGEEQDLRLKERQQKIRGFKESRTGYAAATVARAAKPVVSTGVQTFRQAERRGLRIDPRTAYGTGIAGIDVGVQRRYGAPKSGLAAPQISPVSLPIQSMGSIGRGGASGYEPQRQERQAIPRGTIKSYWSKKVKSLAKANVRKYGPEDGIARTKEIATELGWKMQ